MRTVNFESFDLNLLRVLDALLEEQNVTRAAERLGLSQPAVSRALGRLRHLLRDPLFIRSAGAMVPTPLAMQVGARVHLHLNQLRSALTTTAFDPAVSARHFQVACGDYTTIAFMPAVLAMLRREAPNVHLQLLPFHPDNVRDLDEGKADIIIGNFRNVPERFAMETLVEDHVIGVMREGHPLAAELEKGRPMPPPPQIAIDTLAHKLAGVDSFQTLRGVDQLASHHGDRLPQQKDEEGRSLVRLTVSTQLSGILLVASTDYVMALPRRLYDAVGRSFGLRCYPLPGWPPLSIRLLWHRMHDHDAAHGWLRDLFLRAARQGAGTGVEFRSGAL